MSITKLAQGYFRGRQKAIEAYARHAEEIQHAVFRRLVDEASETEWGRRYDYKNIRDYKHFSERVPVQAYDDIKGYVDRMRRGESDVLWKGQVKWYAKSSGTTNDKSKFIPVSWDGLRRIHYLGGKDAVALYLEQNPSSRLFDGRSLILGGSHAPNYNLPHSLVGDLSAILIENINPMVNLVRVPSKKIALMSDFEQKREAIARFAYSKNVTNLSGVPSWMLSVIKRVLELGNTDNLLDVWPNLEVFFHGGVAFTP
ncbi:MAG: GH3 auxin-responsive promoter family protein, partial [Bacteroidales bacterium]|nr:GH3 auxin-responsive promoter family protein [Bacteroidales bacterium]